MRQEFKLSIDVTVTTNGPEQRGPALAPLINDALGELTSRMDFRRGTFKLGRVLDQNLDFGDQRVTIDVSCMHIQEPQDGG